MVPADHYMKQLWDALDQTVDHRQDGLGLHLKVEEALWIPMLFKFAVPQHLGVQMNPSESGPRGDSSSSTAGVAVPPPPPLTPGISWL